MISREGFPVTIKPLTLWQGGWFVDSWAFAKKDKTTGTLTYIDFTSCVARMQIKQSPDACLAPALSLDSADLGGLSFFSQAIEGFPPAPAFPNAIRLEITEAQSESMIPGTYTFDLFIDGFPSEAHTEPVFVGLLTLHPTGTRPS